MMIRNLPPQLEQQDLLEELNRSGFCGLYDFCYLPMKFNDKQNLGYAFVNFTKSAVAEAMQAAWHKRPRFGGIPTVVDAEVQGLAENAKRWGGSRIRRIKDPKRQPFLLQQSVAPISSSADAMSCCTLNSQVQSIGAASDHFDQHGGRVAEGRTVRSRTRRGGKGKHRRSLVTALA